MKMKKISSDRRRKADEVGYVYTDKELAETVDVPLKDIFTIGRIVFYGIAIILLFIIVSL